MHAGSPPQSAHNQQIVVPNLLLCSHLAQRGPISMATKLFPLTCPSTSSAVTLPVRRSPAGRSDAGQHPSNGY